MKNNLHPNKSRGFTLIELLIVISIIGILAAVLIAVINPVAQQNKARDAGLKASLNKIGLAINAYNSAYGTSSPVYPPNNQFVSVELTNAVTQSGPGGAPYSAGAWVMFSINGVTSPSTCASGYGSGGYAGLGSSTCWFIYRDNSGCVSVKSFGDNTKYWRWQPNAGDVVLTTSSC